MRACRCPKVPAPCAAVLQGAYFGAPISGQMTPSSPKAQDVTVDRRSVIFTTFVKHSVFILFCEIFFQMLRHAVLAAVIAVCSGFNVAIRPAASHALASRAVAPTMLVEHLPAIDAASQLVAAQGLVLPIPAFSPAKVRASRLGLPTLRRSESAWPGRTRWRAGRNRRHPAGQAEARHQDGHSVSSPLLPMSKRPSTSLTALPCPRLSRAAGVCDDVLQHHHHLRHDHPGQGP